MSESVAKPEQAAQNPGEGRPVWNGAKYLEHTKLRDRQGSYDPHFSGLVSKSSGKHINYEDRDIGQAFPFLMKESLRACADLVYPGDAEANMVLDTVGQMMAKIFNDSVEDNLQGLQQFRNLYEDVASIPRGPEVYANWSAFFVQTFFCYLFTVNKVANGLPREICKDVAEYQAMITCVSALDEDLRKQVLRQWQDRGVWPSNLASGKLIRRVDDYIEVIKTGQRLRLEHQARVYKQQNNQPVLPTPELLSKICEQTGLDTATVSAGLDAVALPKWLMDEILTGTTEFKSLAETGKTAEEFFHYLGIRSMEGSPNA